ncbi:MAG TPA: carboxypeptidase-like regulatory domain-containing protein [Gemmatimonadaceae bacterium]
MTHYLRAVSTIAALALCITHSAYAQSESSGRIEGTVTDSVHARPLADAHVVAIGTGAQSEVRREATTDSTGRYRIDSLPLGRYFVGFESALLDSLEVTLSPREANLNAGQAATLDLALPSAKKLRSAVCLGATLPVDAGVIIGHVVSAETESPLAGVKIAMVWRDLGVDRKTLRPINRERSDSVITDKDGWYRMCGVSTGAWVSMQIQHDNRTGAVLRTRVDDTLGIAIRHLSLATAPSRPGESADGKDGEPLSGTATLRGVVRGPGDMPVASAEVRVRDTRAETRTDAQGTYTLGGLPAGTQQLEVRRVGYAVVEVPVDLRSGATTTHDVLMRRIVNLDSVLIVASRPKYPDFYVHQGAGQGHFLGPEAIAKQHVSQTSDYFEKISGFGIVRNGSRTLVVGTQGPAGLRGECIATVIIDGVRVLEYPPTVNDVHWSDVAAIEAYPASVVPNSSPEYRISNGCGGIVIWTKR